MSQYANEGVVSQTSAKPWTGRNGQPITLYSFQLQGSNRWFRTGEDELPFREGDYIRFTNDAKANVQVASVQVGNAPAASAMPPAPAPTGARSGGGGRGRQQSRPPQQSGGQSRDGYWSAKEERDLEKDKRYQEEDIPRMCFTTAQERAVALVSAALAHDCLSFGNMAKGAKLDFVLDCVDQVTDRFVKQTMQSPAHIKTLLEGGNEMYTEEELAESEGYDYDE